MVRHLDQIIPDQAVDLVEAVLVGAVVVMEAVLVDIQEVALQDHLTMAVAVVVVLITPERIRIIKLVLMLVMVWSSLLLTTLLCHGLQHQKIQA